MPHTTGCSMWHMLPTPIVVFVTYGVCDKYHQSRILQKHGGQV